MKKWPYVGTMYLVIILTGLSVMGVNAIAQTPTQATALETKLYQAAKVEGRLNYWDSLSMKEATRFIEAFKKRYPGIEVSYWEGNSIQCDEKYFAESGAGRKPVDVMEINWYRKYKEEGRLTDLTDIVKDTDFPKEFCSKDFDAVAIEHTIRGTAYNTKLVSPKDVPRSWEDLLDLKWKGKIAMENSMDLFIFLTNIWGEEKIVGYLKKLREQNPIFNQGVTQTMTLLSAGEFPVAMNILLHRTLVMQGQRSPVAQVPLGPLVDYFSPRVIVRNAPHPNAAKLFVRWLMSTEGQLLVDQIRKKGNPLPGSGTAQSKAIEQMGLQVRTVPYWEVNTKPLEELYRKTIGFTK